MATSADGAVDGQSTSKAASESKTSEVFDCNICLDTVSSPVVTLCGHLYCWPCLYQWLASRSDCPVCKAGVSVDNVIPVYGRGAEAVDPRSQSQASTEDDDSVDAPIPSRPRGQRPDAEFLQRRRRFQSFPFGHFFQSSGGANHQLNHHNNLNVHGVNTNNANFMSPTMNFFSVLLSGAPFRTAATANDPPNVQLTARDIQQQMQQAFLSRMLFIMGTLVLLCLLMS